jgi:multidrug transporter EmrE-like cation transporter
LVTLVLSRSVSQLQLYTSLIAVAMQLMFIAYNWMASPREEVVESSKDDTSALYVVVLLSFAGLGFYLQSAFAYMLMSLVSPVTHSVANCVKRALIIVLSIYRYGEDVTPLNWSGMALVICGVYFFNSASRSEREAASKGPVITPATMAGAITRSTIASLSEIRIEKGR